MTELPCIHWWVINPPNGEHSKAKCKLCGKQRYFANALTKKAENKGRTLKHHLPVMVNPRTMPKERWDKDAR